MGKLETWEKLTIGIAATLGVGGIVYFITKKKSPSVPNNNAPQPTDICAGMPIVCLPTSTPKPIDAVNPTPTHAPKLINKTVDVSKPNPHTTSTRPNTSAYHKPKHKVGVLSNAIDELIRVTTHVDIGLPTRQDPTMQAIYSIIDFMVNNNGNEHDIKVLKSWYLGLLQPNDTVTSFWVLSNAAGAMVFWASLYHNDIENNVVADAYNKIVAGGDVTANTAAMLEAMTIILKNATTTVQIDDSFKGY